MNEDNLIIKPYGDEDEHASVELIAYSELVGDCYADQMPVLAARVSHAGSGKTGEDPEADLKLMKYLAKHKHMTPFEHTSATFRIVAPIFVIREWHRHRTQSFNEISMRYSDDIVGKFHYPLGGWRQQETRNKQSSAGLIDNQEQADEILYESYKYSLLSYKKLLSLNVCKEQARMVVPVGNYTEMYATANLRNWAHFYGLRHSPDAQWEIRKYADAIDKILSEVYPDSWKCLKEHS